MNWGDEMPHPAAILLFVAILFPLAWLWERRDRKRAEREADALLQMTLELEQENAELLGEVIEHDHADGLIMDAYRTELKRQQRAMERLYRDAGLPMPTVSGRVKEDVVVQTGLPRGTVLTIAVKAHCDGEAAEIVALSDFFRPAA